MGMRQLNKTDRRRMYEVRHPQIIEVYTPQYSSGRAAKWENLKKKYGYICLRCKKTEEESPLTIDHVVPKKSGGNLGFENVQPLCLPCNLSKGNTWVDYRDGNPIPRKLVNGEWLLF